MLVQGLCEHGFDDLIADGAWCSGARLIEQTAQAHGNALFASIGCSLCHTPTLTTGNAIASGSATSVALSHQQANLFSDLLVHHMGSGLADGITQGAAGPDEFRTAPLWGVGQPLRIFLPPAQPFYLSLVLDHERPSRAE